MKAHTPSVSIPLFQQISLQDLNIFNTPRGPYQGLQSFYDAGNVTGLPRVCSMHRDCLQIEDSDVKAVCHRRVTKYSCVQA